MKYFRLIISVSCLFLVTGWFSGLQAFVNLIPKQIDDHTTDCDAIVVLTGGTGRVHEALALLNAKKASTLFISGIGKGANLNTTLILSGNLPDNILDLIGQIQLGFEAENTRENAKEIAQWVKQNNIRSIRLVTSNYHTPRSLLEVTSELPDIKIIPHPVFPNHVRLNEWWQHKGTLSLVLREYHKYIVSRIRIFFV